MIRAWGWRLLLGASFAIVIVTSFFEIHSPDLYWHLKMGRDLLFDGLNPLFDHYSFTFRDRPIIMVAWAFQVAAAGLVEIFGGMKGIVVLRLLIWTFGLCATYRLLKRELKTTPAFALGLLFFLFTCIYRSEPRPELLTIALEPLLLFLLLDWRRNPTRAVSIKIALLMFAWSNYHVSSILGYVVLAAFLLERAFGIARSKKMAEWKSLIAWGLLWIGVGFFNVDLMHPYFQQATLSPEWADFITEYDSVPFALQYLSLQVYWILLAGTIPVMIWRREWAGALIGLMIGLKTFELTKLFPHLVMTTLPFVLISLESLWTSTSLRRSARVTYAFVIFVSIGLVGTNVIQRSLIQPIHPLTGEASPTYVPLDIMELAKRDRIKGRMFNAYHLGGFVMYELAPDVEVYIDGRTNILYSLDHMKTYTQAQIYLEPFMNEVKKYGIDLALGELQGQADLVSVALESGEFEIRYVGMNSILLGAKSTGLATSSRLFMHPECLSENDRASLETELASVAASSPLRSYVEVVLAHLKDSRDASVETLSLSNSFSARLAAEIFWRQGKLVEATRALRAIGRQNAADLVNLAELDCDIGNCANAENYIDHVPTLGIDDFTRYRAYRLLKKIEGQHGLKIFKTERVESLRARVENLIKEDPNPERAGACAHLR
ncbi:MAG: hypothetical protein AAB250_01700 [Bdellovibrionota bacterium]